jgi:hypothetical protein
MVMLVDNVHDRNWTLMKILKGGKEKFPISITLK